VDVFIFLFIHVESFYFPNSSVLPFPDFRERFPYNHYIRKLPTVISLKLFDFLQVHLVQIIAKDCVVEVDKLS